MGKQRLEYEKKIKELNDKYTQAEHEQDCKDDHTLEAHKSES